ncbi:MAG: hypothetical protein E7644_03690 [Ruminococcaceae bacterium]|nr:hypothetical protein [Oscillospiraceae bacterium]
MRNAANKTEHRKDVQLGRHRPSCGWSLRSFYFEWQCYTRQTPPSDEGGGAVGDGGRDNYIANQRQILIVHFLRTSFFVISFDQTFSKVCGCGGTHKKGVSF